MCCSCDRQDVCIIVNTHTHRNKQMLTLIHDTNEQWSHLSPCDFVTLWSCVRLLLGNSHFPCGLHSSGCYLQHRCSAAVSRSNSPLFCFSAQPHTTAARLQVLFELCKCQSPFGGDLVLCCSNTAYTSYRCDVLLRSPNICC